MSTVDKEELVQKAKLAEQSERWVMKQRQNSICQRFMSSFSLIND